MIILDSTKKLQVVLAGAITTNQLPITASWADSDATTFTPGPFTTQTNSTTAVDVVAAPGGGVGRQIKSLTIYNADTASATVSIIVNDAATQRIVCKIVLPVGYTIILLGDELAVFDTTGSRRTVAGATAFIGLSDVPGTYAGAALKQVRVNAGATGLEFTDDTALYFEALTRTAVKTANYTAVAGDLVPCDSTGGGFTVTLPTAPDDRTAICIKHIIQGGTNVITYACGGADVFNKAGGATTGTLPLLAQAVLVVYQASTAIWTIIADDLPLSQLDLRFNALITGGGTNAKFARGDGVWATALNGPYAVGTATGQTATKLLVTGTSDSATAAAVGVLNTETVHQFATTSYAGFKAALSTAASAFVCTDLADFWSSTLSVGAGSSITNRYGVHVDDLSAGTNNFGVWTNVSAGSNKWGYYGVGTASSYFGGSVGIGSSSLSGVSLRVVKNVTGLTSSFGVTSTGITQSDVTVASYGFHTVPTTVAANFTIAGMYGYNVGSISVGAGSTVSNVYGFFSQVQNGATNNYNFYSSENKEPGNPTAFTTGVINNVSITSNVASVTTAGANNYTVGQFVTIAAVTNTQINGTFAVTGAGNPFTYSVTTADVASTADTGSTTAQRRFAFNAAGTANSFFGGPVGLNSTAVGNFNGVNFRNSLTITGNTTSFSNLTDGVVQSSVTAFASAYASNLGTAASAFTLTTLAHFYAVQSTIGATSAVTTQTGFFASSSLTGATNNYGFRGAIASAANRYNLFMDGTASNHLSGTTLVGTTTDDTVSKLQVNGDFACVTAGNRIRVKEGTNGFVGQVALVAGTKAITITGVTTASRAFISLVAVGGTMAQQYQGVCTANTLTITALLAAGTIQTLDTSTVNYMVVN